MACRPTDTLRRSSDEGRDAHDSPLQTHKHTASDTAVRHALFTGAAGLSTATWVSVCERSLHLSMFRARRSGGKDLAPRQGGTRDLPQALPMTISNDNCDSFWSPANALSCAGNVVASRYNERRYAPSTLESDPEPVAGYVVYLGVQASNSTQLTASAIAPRSHGRMLSQDSCTAFKSLHMWTR